MAILVGCPSAFGYFPNEADRLPPSAAGNHGINVTERPYWLTRNLGSGDEWGVISGSEPPSFSQNQEIIARSRTPLAKVFYAYGGTPSVPDLPTYSAAAINESRPLTLTGSSASQTYTAIALATYHLPSHFSTVTIRLDARVASTPTFWPIPAENFTSAQTLEIRGLSEGTTAWYEFATSDTDGDSDIDEDDVSTPTPASTAYSTPISILADGGDVYCIKVMAHHPEGIYLDSTVASGCYKRLPAASPPTLNPTPGNFTSAQTLTITSATTGTTAYYEAATSDTNGDGDIDPDDVSTPSSASTAYSTPLEYSGQCGGFLLHKGHSSRYHRHFLFGLGCCRWLL